MTVAELLDRPEKWCGSAYARDSAGQIVEPMSSSAVRWSLCGAIERCKKQYEYQRVLAVLRNVVGVDGHWNMSHIENMSIVTFADIRRVIEAAGI